MRNLLKEYYSFINEIPLNKQYLYGFSIAQNMEEIQLVCDFLGRNKYKSFIEIGSSCGGSLWLYTNLLCELGAKVIAIEPQDNKSLQYTINKLNNKGYYPYWLRTTSDGCSESFENETIELLHIDASHAYEDIEKDFKLFYPKVIKNGIILIHDTALHNGVIRFKNELENKGYKIRTFKDSSYPIGISVMIKGEGTRTECLNCKGKGYIV